MCIVYGRRVHTKRCCRSVCRLDIHCSPGNQDYAVQHGVTAHLTEIEVLFAVTNDCLRQHTRAHSHYYSEGFCCNVSLISDSSGRFPTQLQHKLYEAYTHLILKHKLCNRILLQIERIQSTLAPLRYVILQSKSILRQTTPTSVPVQFIMGFHFIPQTLM